MYLNHYPQHQTEREIEFSVTPAYGIFDAEEMLACMIEGCSASCTVEEARSLLSALEDGQALKEFGLSDADQEWVEELHADIAAALQD